MTLRTIKNAMIKPSAHRPNFLRILYFIAAGCFVAALCLPAGPGSISNFGASGSRSMLMSYLHVIFTGFDAWEFFQFEMDMRRLNNGGDTTVMIIKRLITGILISVAAVLGMNSLMVSLITPRLKWLSLTGMIIGFSTVACFIWHDAYRIVGQPRFLYFGFYLWSMWCIVLFLLLIVEWFFTNRNQTRTPVTSILNNTPTPQCPPPELR